MKNVSLDRALTLSKNLKSAAKEIDECIAALNNERSPHTESERKLIQRELDDLVNNWSYPNE
jgi:hypothetical protein